MWLLKLPLNLWSNGNFKSHINFGGQKEDKGMMCIITHLELQQVAIQNYDMC